MYNEMFQKAKTFVYRNARPLDFARWQYHFENGTKDSVLSILSKYQNEDGGFGHALECDAWNPNSSPIQTCHATIILKEIDFSDKSHPIIKGIVKYLSSGADFNQNYWYRTIPSNDNYPHAPWWACDKDYNTAVYYNPTAALAGFLLYYADVDTAIYQAALRIANEAIEQFISEDCNEMHLLKCFVELKEYIQAANVSGVKYFSEFNEKLTRQVLSTIEKDSEKWPNTYCCKPSYFIPSKKSDFYTGFEQLCNQEVLQMYESQQENGAWKITWGWSDFHSEFAISANWWQTNFIIESLLFAKNML